MNNNVSKNNNNFIFSINKKRKLDSSYLWHCRLAHIGKTRIQKLQREGLLESINDESFDKCESCISRKMTKKPFNNNIERATDLLGLIHTDVCGPLRHVSRKEVELQLGKKIKALRSNRGGKYLSQEFKDYLSKNGIVQHFTSPYTPQQNGVSERRNRTSLYMVRSMFNLMTLPLSVMDYALEFAVHILNMVSTKKVDKTPPGQKPHSYLRYGNFLERDLISQKFSGRDNDLEYDHMDTLPSENTSEIPVESESLGSPQKLIFVRAMDEEMNSMKVMKVWIVVDLPPNAKVVRSKWLYKKKTDIDDIRAIRILIAISAYYDYEIWQMDVKTAFLNGRLDEDIYMEQPEWYVDPKYPNRDLGEITYILGIKIYIDRSRRLIGLSQSAYIDKILKKYNMHNSKKGYLPMEVKHDLSNELCASTPEEVAYIKKVPYASAVGSIMYAVRCTRPDVPFAQNLVSRYQHNPGKLHWVAVKHILKYLRNTRDMSLVYGGKPLIELDVTSFCDASWQFDKDDTKSQTGYVFIVNGGAGDWKSKKQTTIAMHLAQAEYVAASEAAMEAVWIRKFVGDLGVMPSINKHINVYCGNYAAIIFAKN
nr:retrotransposon protein, putative, Ty1-copia subclass [Tanacetum cinerariifolium]